MIKQLQIFKKNILGNSNVFKKDAKKIGSDRLPLQMEKVLVVSKLSHLEFERQKHKHLSEEELKKTLIRRGSDYGKLVYYHNLHKSFEKRVIDTFKSFNAEIRVANRFDFKDDHTHWADILVTTGGDGTFLLAASRVRNNFKPVIGFNSDPSRSEGHLCLPKKYSFNIKEAIENLKAGKFKWLLRRRIRTTLYCQNKQLVPKYLHIFEAEPDLASYVPTCVKAEDGGSILPFLALNEVFIGESLTARVSHLEMYLDNSDEPTNMKCSGLCVSTGTGSSSWHLSINRIPVQTVAEILRLLDIQATEEKESLATVLADIYNQNLIFDPENTKMGYTVRDLISAGVWPQPKGLKARAFADKIKVKSRCVDACIAVDGGVSFEFNDGAVAVLEIKPEDALRTVIMAS